MAPTTNLKEVSIKEFYTGLKTVFKVTKHISRYSISETRFFDEKSDALKQLNDWMEE